MDMNKIMRMLRIIVLTISLNYLKRLTTTKAVTATKKTW